MTEKSSEKLKYLTLTRFHEVIYFKLKWVKCPLCPMITMSILYKLITKMPSACRSDKNSKRK